MDRRGGGIRVSRNGNSNPWSRTDERWQWAAAQMRRPWEVGLPELTLIIRSEVGLHARLAAKLATVARRFEGNIVVTYGGKQANAKSILRVLALGVTQGSSITIRSDGEDAGQALDALATLIEGNFGGQR